ncbi:MAG: diaminopimelate decarboxylase [Candidatus Taylorbacteria bacterium]|nr:diaminopimelate decarboxylase [Candidatus Taylorbacteria bacterium]
MPMSKKFEERLFPHLPAIAREFKTPFHVYDEIGIEETGERLKNAFAGCLGFCEYFAVKALPNPAILSIMHRLGFGFDCSSKIELELAREAGATPKEIMFTSNNTTQDEFRAAQADGGCVINLDDVSLIAKVPEPFPEIICFRLNPGKERTGNSIIGEPEKAKYGITWDQLISAYRMANKRGETKFGLHTMVCSNERNYQYMVETVRMLLRATLILHQELGICLSFVNMGGGIGIPYIPGEHEEFDIEKLGQECELLFSNFAEDHNWLPKLYMESGRYMTGPHGVLVSRAINRKDIYQTHIGVDAGMPALMRPAMYNAYHHITVLDRDGKSRGTEQGTEIVNIVGSICENCDRLATDRELPKIQVGEGKGDFIVTHDTGAHGIAMGFNYNGRTRPKELLLRRNGTVELIRRAETDNDLRATLRFEPKTLTL